MVPRTNSERGSSERRRAVRPPTFKGEARGEVFQLDPGRVQPLPVHQLAATLSELHRPLLVHHWASWDEASVRSLPRLVEALSPLLEREEFVLLDLGWDRLREAPTGRIPGMAQRPARWWDGSELQAWHRKHGLPWVTRFLTGSADAVRDEAPEDPFVLPALELWEPGAQLGRRIRADQLS